MRTSVVKAPYTQFLNVPCSKLLIQFDLHSVTASLKETRFFTRGSAHRADIRSRKVAGSIPDGVTGIFH